MATNNDGKIYITITDERNGGGPANSQQATNTQQEDEEQENLGESFTSHQFYNFIVSEAKQMASYTLGNIGNFTGDYTLQRNVNSVVSAVGKVGNLVMAGVAGGVAGLVIAGASMAITSGLSTYSDIVANKRTNAQIEKIRNISGLDSLTNGSR